MTVQHKVNDYNLHNTLMTPMSVKPPPLRHWNANPLSLRKTFWNSNVKGSITLKLGGNGSVPKLELPGERWWRVVNCSHLNVTLSPSITSIGTCGASWGSCPWSTEAFSVIWPVRLLETNTLWNYHPHTVYSVQYCNKLWNFLTMLKKFNGPLFCLWTTCMVRMTDYRNLAVVACTICKLRISESWYPWTQDNTVA